jgi:hypothetical protein
LPKAVALKRLLDDCVVVPKRLEVSDVSALVRWIACIPCHALSYSRTEDAVTAVLKAFPSGVFTQ